MTLIWIAQANCSNCRVVYGLPFHSSLCHSTFIFLYIRTLWHVHCTITALNLIAIKSDCKNPIALPNHSQDAQMERNRKNMMILSTIPTWVWKHHKFSDQCIAIFPKVWKKLAPNTTAIVYGGPKKSRGTTCNYNHENRSQECAHSNVKFLVLCVWQWQFKTGSKL